MNNEVLISKKDYTKEYKSYADLKGETVGAQSGTFIAADIQKSGLFPRLQLFASGPELEQAVIDG